MGIDETTLIYRAIEYANKHNKPILLYNDEKSKGVLYKPNTIPTDKIPLILPTITDAEIEGMAENND